MCGRDFWKGVTTFCLTFAIGFFISDKFASNNFIPKEIKQQEANSLSVLSEPSKERQSYSGKLQCKEYPDSSEDLSSVISKLAALNKEIIETENSLKRDKNLSSEMKERFSLKLDEAKRKFNDLFNSLLERKSLQSESETFHNLLYMENCDRY